MVSRARTCRHLDADRSGEVEFETFLKWHFADRVETPAMGIQDRYS